MAVYTEVGFDEADRLVRSLGLGALTDLRGIRSGIENTNYYANTAQGQWVLTVFERLTREQLPYYLHLMQHLALRGIPVPAPQAAPDGSLLHTAGGKPAAVVTRLPGSHRLAPDAQHGAQVGAMLARMHLAGLDFGMQQPHLRGLAWWAETVPVVRPYLTPEQAARLTDELAFQQKVAASAMGQALPRGPIHADLFRDNVMFEGLPGREQLSGFFDFYFAGVDTWLFDIAVCLNDWCIDLATGRLDEARAQAFVQAYERERPLSGTEHRLMPAMLRAAALRFWISRLWDFHLPRSASLLTPHDPRHFERVLRQRVAAPITP